MAERATRQEIIDKYLSDEAVVHLKKYFTQNSGRHFETLNDGTTVEDADHRILAIDIAAVSTLTVTFDHGSVVELLVTKKPLIDAALSEVPSGLALWEIPADEFVNRDAPAWRADAAIRAVSGLGPTKVSKLLARKRPQLFPIFDSVVGSALGFPKDDDTGWWEYCWSLFNDDDSQPLLDRLHALKAGADLPAEVSLLRVFDVAIWTQAREAN